MIVMVVMIVMIVMRVIAMPSLFSMPRRFTWSWLWIGFVLAIHGVGLDSSLRPIGRVHSYPF